MKKFGLIGYPLGHSFSKKYFAEKFRDEQITGAVYENYPIGNISMINDLIKDHELCGLNVTIPYKQQVMDYLDEIDPEAKAVGAVNTVSIIRLGDKTILKGYNTDIFGFEQPLLDKLKPIHTSAIILGTGGASKAVRYILDKHGIRYHYVSRSPKDDTVYSYSQLSPEIIENNKLIINTSPVGMYPHADQCPDIHYGSIGKDHILYDLVYNPEKTLFLIKGEEQGASIINGLPMLHIQAAKAWEIWNRNRA